METSLSALATLVGGSFIGPDTKISSLVSSSANCNPGTLFVAVAGTQSDGHNYLNDAFARGASAAVVQNIKALGDRPGIVVQDTRRALSTLASFFALDPAREMRVVALTGTNGKTTTNWLVYNALNRLGVPSVRIGTIGIRAEGVVDLPGNLTTPDPISLHQVLAQCLSAGVQGCVIEASSHAIDQKRVEDLDPDVAVFTNLTRDHLDYHGTMDAYFQSKAHLFELLLASKKKTKGAVINLDDEYGMRLQKAVLKSCQDFSFGFSKDAAIRILSFDESAAQGPILKLSAKGELIELQTPLIGAHNALNLAAAFGCCMALGFPATLVAAALTGVDAAPGRLELVKGNGFDVYVDYAHTPDALERVLLALKPTTKGKLWVVFGCGGDRDRGKRPIMGEIAGRLADCVVVTSDNPRGEDPLAIINEIVASGAKRTAVEPDRAKAIQLAITSAEAGDSVLVAGKGHEDYQILGKQRIHFSDVEEAKKAIALRKQG